MPPLEVACPGCQATLKAPNSMAGKKVKCKKCGVAFRIPSPQQPSGQTSGDGQLPSIDDLPIIEESAANPFDFSAPVSEPTEPKKSKSDVRPALSTPAPVALTQASKPSLLPARDQKIEPAKPVAPEVQPAEEDVPMALSVDDDKPDAPAKIVGSTATEKAPSAKPNEKPTSKHRSSPKKPAIEEKPKESEGPFSFGTEQTAPVPGREKSVGKSKPARETDDPFAFGVGDTKPTVAPRAEDSQKKSIGTDTEVTARKKSRPTEAARTDPSNARGTGIGKLIVLVAVFALVFGGVVGGALLYLNSNKAVEQVQVEKKATEVTDALPPDPAPAPTKAESKETTKESLKIAKNQQSRGGARAKAPTSAPAPSGVLDNAKPIQFLPIAAKLEMAQVPTKLSIDPALGPKFVSAFSAVRRVFPPLERNADPAVLCQIDAGFQGVGEKLLLSIHSPTSGKQVNKVEFDGDGSPQPLCDLSAKVDTFIQAHSLDGKVNVWSTRNGSKKVDNFSPYADKPTLKDAKIAAVYLTEPADRFVTVSTTGVVHVWDMSTKALVGEFTPPKQPSTPLVAGKSVVSGPARLSVVLMIDGTVYLIGVRKDVSVEKTINIGGDFGRPAGLAMSGDGRVVYIFELPGDKKEKGVMSFRSEEKRQMYRWPDSAGEPLTVSWCGDVASVSTSRGSAVWFVAEADSFHPLALAQTPCEKAIHIAYDDHWSLIPDPADPKKCLLLEFTRPQQAFENALEGLKKQPPTVEINEKGLFK